MRRPRPLADLLPDTLGPALAAHGFADQDIIASWPDIVGERLAASSAPARVDWPRRDRTAGFDRRPDPATLIVRVESAFALELQHLVPQVIERVNAFYGWRCVGRIVLKQGPVARRKRPTPRPVPSAEAERRVSAAVTGVAEQELGAALARLGREVLAVEEARLSGKNPAGAPRKA